MMKWGRHKTREKQPTRKTGKKIRLKEIKKEIKK